MLLGDLGAEIIKVEEPGKNLDSDLMKRQYLRNQYRVSLQLT